MQIQDHNDQGAVIQLQRWDMNLPLSNVTIRTIGESTPRRAILRRPLRMTTIYNFNAGPAQLPPEVLERAQAELRDYQGTGMSIMEMSHRSREFEALVTR